MFVELSVKLLHLGEEWSQDPQNITVQLAYVDFGCRDRAILIAIQLRKYVEEGFSFQGFVYFMGLLANFEAFWRRTMALGFLQSHIVQVLTNRKASMVSFLWCFCYIFFLFLLLFLFFQCLFVGIFFHTLFERHTVYYHLG